MNKACKKALKVVLTEKKYKEMQDGHRKHVRQKNIDRKIQTFHNEFNAIMGEKRIATNQDLTITPTNIEYINNSNTEAMTCNLKFPRGLSVSDIRTDKIIDALEANVFGRCMVQIEVPDIGSQNSDVAFAAIKKWHDCKYTPVTEYKGKKLTASQMFLGYTIDMKPIIIDMAKAPHVLITGGTNGGKSKLTEIMLTNLAHTATPDDLELYFIQATKSDAFKYETLEHCKGCVTNYGCKDSVEVYTRILTLLRFINAELSRREKMTFDIGRRAEDLNINVYNEKFPDKKMKVLQLWIDEAMALYTKTGNKEIDKMIVECSAILSKIITAGRYVGIYMVNILQRATKDELPRIIKTNTMNWISFCQVDKSSSQVAIGDEKSALGIPQRVFCYKAGSEKVYFGKTPFSNWELNLKNLEKEDRVRLDTSDENLARIYSTWLDDLETVVEDISDKGKGKNKENRRLNGKVKNDGELNNSSKDEIKDKAIGVLNDQLKEKDVELNNLSMSNEMKLKAIKNYQKRNSELLELLKKAGINPDEKSIESESDDNNVIIDAEIGAQKVESDKDDVIVSEELKLDSEPVNDNKNDNPYKKLDLSKLNLKIK